MRVTTADANSVSEKPVHPQLVRLSSSYTVTQYLALVDAKDVNSIATFVVERFEDRYIKAIDLEPSRKNGFTMMAICCLMIEALESFQRGWPNSKAKSDLAFCSFFSRWAPFSTFSPVAHEFYVHVRCGILHQAETTGGWRILRSGALRADTTINATKFMTALRSVLHSYGALLRNGQWESPIWVAFRKKMEAVCANTKS